MQDLLLLQPDPKPGLTSVWLVEDRLEYRETIEELLDYEEDLICSRSFATCEDMFEALLEEPPPDIVLMDIVIPDHMSGIDGVKKLHQMLPDVHVVMLTNYSDDDKIFQALCNGASGYLLKLAEPEKVIESVYEARSGGVVMSPQIARRVITMFTDYAVPSNDYNLTERELEVLGLLVEGLKKKEIADALFLAFATIDTHMRNIYIKLHVHSRTEAVVKALRERLI